MSIPKPILKDTSHLYKNVDFGYTQEELAAKLQQKFDIDDGLDFKGTAFIPVVCLDSDGIRYFINTRIKEEWLKDRHFRYEFYDYKVGIVVFDDQYDGIKSHNPLNKKG